MAPGGQAPSPKLWSTMMESEMLHLCPVVLKKRRTFPKLSDHIAAPQKASTAPSFRFATNLMGSPYHTVHHWHGH